MTFARRIAIGLGVAVALPLALAWVISASQATERRETDELLIRGNRSLQLMTLLERLVVDMESGLRGFWNTGDEAFLEPYLQAAVRYGPAVQELKQLVETAEVSAVDEVHRAVQEWRLGFAEPRITFARQNPPRVGGGLRIITDPGYELSPHAGKRAMDAVRGRFDRLKEAAQTRIVKEMDAVAASRRRLERVLWGTASAYSLLLIAGSAALFRSYRTRARVLFAGIESAEQGRYGTIPLSGKDELGRVAGALNRTLYEVERRDDELRRAAEAADRARVELDRFFSLSLELLCIAGFDGRFKRLNAAWSRLLGYPLESLVGRPFLELVHPDDRAATEAEARKLAAGDDTVSFENRYRCADGSYRWLVWSATPVVSLELIYASARDISDRKRLESELQARAAALEEANRELEAFSYSVSHDLRAPLRHVDGFAKLLSRRAEVKLDEKERHYLTTISDSARRMGTLIDDLLAFSRVGRAELRKSSVDLQALAEDVRRDVLASVNGRAVEWSIGPLPTVEADPALLRQVLANLLENAVKYTGGRAVAHISVAARCGAAGETVCSVKDDGAGFDMEYAGRLFGVFQRLHLAEEFEGTGIGLANVKRIVERHGGRVWAEGSPGQGATFSFSLPGKD